MYNGTFVIGIRPSSVYVEIIRELPAPASAPLVNDRFASLRSPSAAIAVLPTAQVTF
jgi:hypothetical protein